MSEQMKLIGAIEALEQLLADHQTTLGASERPFNVVESADIKARINAMKDALHAQRQADTEYGETAAKDALENLSASPVAQKDAVLAFVLQNHLAHELQAFLESQPTVELSPSDHFLLDVAHEIGTMIPWAQKKAQMALQFGRFDATRYYPSNTGARVDRTALKCFLHALGKEIITQYRPLSESKSVKELTNHFAQSM